MKYSNLLLSIVLLLFLSATGEELFAQCSPEVKYTIKHSIKGGSSGEVRVQASALVSGAKLSLYRIDSGNELVDSQEKNSSSDEIVFGNLRPSNYLVQVVSAGCRKTLGGIEGIIIKEIKE